MNRAAYEQMFADYFGIRSVIWLGEGIEGDDTHGHVDDLTRFVAPDTVVTMVEPNERDENYSALHHNLGRLRAARDPDGQRLNIVEIPMPRPVVFEGRRLPASYANFYIANGMVLVPVFNDPNDRVALNTLAAVVPCPRDRADLFRRPDLGLWGAALHDAARTDRAPVRGELRSPESPGRLCPGKVFSLLPTRSRRLPPTSAGLQSPPSLPFFRLRSPAPDQGAAPSTAQQPGRT